MQSGLFTNAHVQQQLSLQFALLLTSAITAGSPAAAEVSHTVIIGLLSRGQDDCNEHVAM